MSRLTIFILIGIVIVAAGMRLYGLDKQSLWYEEVYEEKAFQRLFLGDKTIVAPDTPPLNSFFIFFITKIFPDSSFALRMIPFTFGLMSVPLLFVLGRELFNERVGLIASFLLAISPFHIWHSQDARMYALQWMFALISLIYFVRALEKPYLKNYIGYVISTVAGLYTIQLTIFLVGLQALYLLLFLRKYKDQFYKWISVFSVTVVLYLPWIIYYLKSSIDHPSGVQKKVNLIVKLSYTIFVYCTGYSIGPSVRELHIDQSMSVVRPYLAEIMSIMILYGILFILGLWSIRKDHTRLVFLFLLQTVPIIGVLTISKIMPHIAYNVRYTGIALFGFLIFISKGIERLRLLKSKTIGIILTVTALVMIAGFSVYSYTNYQFDKRYQKEDIRGAVAYIKEEKREGDTFLCIVNAGVFNRYSKGDPQCKGFPMAAKDDKKMVDVEMRKRVEGKKRLWLVLSREWYAGKIGYYIKAWLDTNYKEIKQLHKGVTEIANVRIYCYDLTRKK